MSNDDLLIDHLSSGLRPVDRPRPAALRALGWSAVILPLGFLTTRLMHTYRPDWSAPGMGWAAAEIALAMMLGLGCVVLAFEASIAGRSAQSRRTSGRFLVGLAMVWLGVSAANILATPGLGSYRPGAGLYCYSFMLLAAVPTIPLMIVGLRRTRAIRPRRTLMLAGLGLAFLVAGLLGFCHPGTLHIIDFCAHLLGGLSIVILMNLFGRVIAA